MAKIISSIFALLLSVALLLTANGLLGVLLPVRALSQGFSSIDVGIMGTAYFGGFFVGCLLGPKLVNRVGHIRTFAALTSVVCALTLVHGLFDEKIVWWLARSVTGVCFAILFIVIESWLSEKSTNDNRGAVFSVYTILNLSVVAVGQFTITLMSTQGFELFALASILISMSTVPVAVSLSSAPSKITAAQMRLGYLFDRSRVAVIGCLGVGMANGAFWTLAPVFSKLNTDDVDSVAIFMTLTVVAGGLGQWPLGWLSDHIDRRRVIAGAGIGASLSSVLVVAITLTNPNLAYVGAMVFGAFAFPLYALCAAHLYDLVEPDGYVEATGGLLMAYSAGAITGPLIAAALMENFGAHCLFLYTAAIHISVAVYANYRMGIKGPTIVVEKAAFSDALVMTTVSGDIDPRAETEQRE